MRQVLAFGLRVKYSLDLFFTATLCCLALPCVALPRSVGRSALWSRHPTHGIRDHYSAYTIHTQRPLNGRPLSAPIQKILAAGVQCPGATHFRREQALISTFREQPSSGCTYSSKSKRVSLPELNCPKEECVRLQAKDMIDMFQGLDHVSLIVR